MRTTRRLDRDRHRAGRALLHHRVGLRTRLFQFVDPFDDEKDTKRNDGEIDRDGDEIAVRKYGTQFFCVSQGKPGVTLSDSGM